MWSLIFTYAFPLVLVSFTIVIIRWLFPATATTTKKRLPPSPWGLPILGHLHKLGPQPYRSLQRLAKCHGELMMLDFGVRPALIVSSADAAREILKNNDVIYSNRPVLTISDKLLYQGRDVASSRYGEYWRKVRSICVIQILSTTKVQSFRNERREEMELLVQDIENSAKQSLSVNLSQRFTSLTIDMICRAAFGKKYTTKVGGRGFKEILDEFLRCLGGFYVGDFIPWLSWIDRISGLDAKVDRVFNEFDAFLGVIVDEHMEAYKMKQESEDASVRDAEAKHFVDALLEVKSGGSALDTNSIKGIILDMFSGGTDTAYSLLEWGMAEIIRHPRVLAKLQEETMNISESRSYITESEVGKLHYLKAVVKETLRLHPPIPLQSREPSEDTQIMGYDIAAGTMVFTNAWAIGRDPKEWEEPEEFRPERFIASTVDYKGHDYQYLPFGAGRRGCPGTLFAITTDELMLANLVHKFDWELPNGTRPEDLDVTENTGFISHTKFPLIAVAKPRSF